MRKKDSMTFLFGLASFIIGIALISDLLIKFVRFAIGILLIIVGMQLVLGSRRWIR